jgi:Leucine-rich repeat (LRR) protein
MGNDIEIIKQIEEKIWNRLKRLDIGNVIGTHNGYVMDENENVIGLNLYDWDISGISFLEDLNHLTHLNLGSNQISDISPVKELNALTHLFLFENKISDYNGPLKLDKKLSL